MSNIQNKASSSSSVLQYSMSSSQNNLFVSHQRITQSLQHLDRIRSLNKKIFNSEQQQSSSLISPLQKLINSQKQITYIDNQRVYGIIKIQTLINLKSRVQQLEIQSEKNKQKQHQLSSRGIYTDAQLSNLKSRNNQLTVLVQRIKDALQLEKNQRKRHEHNSEKLSATILALNEQKIETSRDFLGLKQAFEQFKADKQKKYQNGELHYMICQSQTQFYKPTIQIAPFEANLEEMLRKLRQKQGQKISRPTLKQVISQSLDSFVKQLDSQYKTIREQTLDLTALRQQNRDLAQENSSLKKTLDQIHLEEDRLKIFKSCMAEFLTDASENVSKLIQAERVKRIYTQLSQQQKNLIIQSVSFAQSQGNEGQEQNPNGEQFKLLKQGLDFLKKQNINLLKTLGQYQYKWRNIEKVVDERDKQEISDEGTVGQLVKMSRLVKQSIKNLLQQL